MPLGLRTAVSGPAGSVAPDPRTGLLAGRRTGPANERGCAFKREPLGMALDFCLLNHSHGALRST